MAKKKSKWLRAQERFERFMTAERMKAIDDFLQKWDELADDEELFNLRGQLWDEIQDSSQPAKIRNLRDRYLRSLEKWVQKERKAVTEKFPYNERK